MATMILTANEYVTKPFIVSTVQMMLSTKLKKLI